MPRVKDRLAQLEVRPTRRLGQNFLIDAAAIAEIIQFGAPCAGDNLVEIGPGLGALTAELSRFPRLTLIEIEEKFCAELIKKYPRARVLNEDVRAVDLAELGSDLVVFGNLPYAFSTAIVFYLVDFAPCIRRAVLMLQREFAARLAAGPGGRDYGVLSISCQLWAEVGLGPVVGGDSFHPPAKVESQLVELVFAKAPRVPVEDMFLFKRVVAAAFFKRRKKIANSLRISGAFAGPQIEAALERAGIDPGRRAETVSLEEYARLSAAFGEDQPPPEAAGE